MNKLMRQDEQHKYIQEQQQNGKLQEKNASQLQQPLEYVCGRLVSGAPATALLPALLQPGLPLVTPFQADMQAGELLSVSAGCPHAVLNLTAAHWRCRATTSTSLMCRAAYGAGQGRADVWARQKASHGTGGAGMGRWGHQEKVRRRDDQQADFSLMYFLMLF
jgi:hypothetical protein